MANGFGSFYVGNSGLQNAQNAINTTANNLSNVNTTGYVREQVRFADKHYIVRNNPTIGTNIQQSGLGVTISDVAHVRDIFLDKSYRQESGRKEFYSKLYESTSYVESILQELDGVEFKESVAGLWQAFQEYAKDPSNSTNQSLVLQKGELLLSRSNAVYSSLQDYQTNMNQQIKQAVDRVNEIGEEIFKLNCQIIKVEAGGVETAMTMRDERDLLLDELAGYFKIEATEDSEGFVYVKLEGQSFIESNKSNQIGLLAESGSGFYTPYWTHLTNKEGFMPVYTDVALSTELQATTGNTQKTTISTEMNNDIGSVKALCIARGSEYGSFNFMLEENYDQIEDCVAMETQAEVSYLVRSIIMTMNDIFCPNTTYTAADGTQYTVLDAENCSVGADGELPPQELFVRDGISRYRQMEIDGKTFYVYNEESNTDLSSWYKLGNVSINPELLVEVTKMPSYKQDGAVNYELGDIVTDAWASKNMYINPKDTSPCNFEGYYDKIVARLGTSGSVYKSSADTLESTVSSIDNQRNQIMGVSSDEELTNMIKFQSAYNASSRYITVISQMTELIVGLI